MTLKRVSFAAPAVQDRAAVGTYPALAKAGGGYVWDEVLEYRVWCHSVSGEDDGFYAFDEYEDAFDFAVSTEGAQAPLALVLQREYIDEDATGAFRHVREVRVTEWPVEFLSRPRRDARTIPDFFAPDAPKNRIDIVRGKAPRP